MSVTLPNDLRMVIEAEIKTSSQARVARRLQIAPSTLSELMTGKYRGADKILNRLRSAFEGVNCPHLKRQIELEKCTSNRTRAMPQSSASAMDLWQACQTCTLFSKDA